MIHDSLGNHYPTEFSLLGSLFYMKEQWERDVADLVGRAACQSDVHAKI